MADSLTYIWAAEVEWYLRDASGAPVCHDALPIDTYFASLRARAEEEGIALESLDLERGPGQVEAAFAMTPSRDALAKTINVFLLIAVEEAEKLKLIADYSAKPFANEYGNGLHVHVHLEDAAGQNLFWKEEEELSPHLRDALAGLLTKMPEDMSIFLPSGASWERIEKGYHAPISMTWGGNNRTVALRLPDGSANVAGPKALAAHPRARTRRIEHRMAGADADPASVMEAIEFAIRYGLEHHPPLPSPIFGDAGDDQYIREENRFRRPG